MAGALRRSELDEVESSINSLIERRATARQTDDRDREEESFMEMTRAHNARRREALRWEWIRYFERLSESFRQRSEECARKAAALDSGETPPGGSEGL